MREADFAGAPAMSREVNLSIYSRKALADTQAAFRGFCIASVKQISATRVEVSVTACGDGLQDARTTLLEFWNYLLDKSTQERLS